MSKEVDLRWAALLVSVAAIAPLGACSELDRAIGCLDSSAQAGAQGGTASASGAPGVAGAAGTSLPETSCAPLEKCGGDLLASAMVVNGTPQVEWVGTVQDTCTDPPQPEPEGDCYGLAIQANGTLRFRPVFPANPLVAVRLIFTARDHRYEVHYVRQGPQTYRFSAACRAAQPLRLGCQELGRAIAVAVASEASFSHVQCADDADGGCSCTDDLELFSASQGSFDTSSASVTLRDEGLPLLPPSAADYCQRADSLELTATSSLGLFNVRDWRSVVLHPPTCNDGIQDQDETGIDCGGSCPQPCGTCADGLQNQDEAGVDCDGVCLDTCSCFNAVQDPWEEGLDCGGPCALLCSCRDGVQDGNEAGVDCGGDCESRFGAGDGVPIPCR